MQIRPATKEDYQHIASFLLLAMEDIVFEFIGSKNVDHARAFMEHFTQMPGNQYSYENTFMAEENGNLLGCITLYDGADLHNLRTPVKQYIEQKIGLPFNPEDETQAGEIYLDCIGVNPQFQGKGIGSSLLSFVIEKFVDGEGKTIGLLVDKDNPVAKKLYLKLGFKVINDTTLVGKPMEHLQFSK